MSKGRNKPDPMAAAAASFAERAAAVARPEDTAGRWLQPVTLGSDHL